MEDSVNENQELAGVATECPLTALAQDSRGFLRGNPFLVSEKDVQTRWGFQQPGSGTVFRCAWCGHKFQEGDTARCLYTNTAPEHALIRGNPFVCGLCDGADAIERLLAMAERVKQVKHECWWFFRRDK